MLERANSLWDTKGSPELFLCLFRLSLQDVGKNIAAIAGGK